MDKYEYAFDKLVKLANRIEFKMSSTEALAEISNMLDEIKKEEHVHKN